MNEKESIPCGSDVDKVSETKLVFNNNSKTDIHAKNYNKSKVFDIKSHNLSVDLSRVDSQNYPDTTETLDYIAVKMGLNQNNNNNKSEHTQMKRVIEEKCPSNEFKQPGPVTPIADSMSNPDTEAPKSTDQHKKVNIMTKIIRRLSRPTMFSKDNKKQRKSKNKDKPLADSSQKSPSSDVKSSAISENINHQPARSKSFRKIFSRFGNKGKHKGTMLSDGPSSVDSRPSVSSAINTAAVIVDCVGSCNNVYVDKLCKEDLEKYNSSSVDCILDHGVRRLLKQEESESSNSEDLRDHERKMNASNHQIVSIFPPDTNGIMNSEEGDNAMRVDDDKLSPLNINMNLASLSVDGDRTCHSAMSAHSTETSSNVKLTLSLYGYTTYGLSSSKFSSKSCMEFRSAHVFPKVKASMDNIAIFTGEVKPTDSNGKESVDVTDMLVVNEDIEVVQSDLEDSKHISHIYEEVVNDIKLEEHPVTDATDIVIRKSNRPTDIQLRRSRMTSQTSMARSSLIMVAVAHNSPRTKGVGNYTGTPVYNPESPSFTGKKLDFEEESKSIEEEHTNKVEAERNGNDFLIIANQYETELLGKIEIVHQYLESFSDKMDEDVIGELNTAVGLAKLLLSEKFVQFRTLCEKNVRDTTEDGEFKTLACDLEGYLTTLEIQLANLGKKFENIERIRGNAWRMLPTLCPVTPSGPRKKSKSTSKTPAADTQRSQESRRRIAEFKKMSAAAAGQSQSSSLLVIQ